MDCKEFNGLIHDFLNDRLNETELSEFLAHIESCDNCRDELRIQYLIYEGLERLEAGDTFDVDRDLADVMKLQKRMGIKMAAIASEIITISAFVIVLFLVLFY